MSPIKTPSFLFALVASSLAAPLQHGIINITARGPMVNASTADTDDFIFDPTYPEQEIREIVNKYRDAAKFLHDTGLPSLASTVLKDFRVSEATQRALDAAYAGNGEISSATEAQTSMSLIDDISGNLDLLYYGPLQVGSSNQRLTFDFDTGSADLWMPVDCSNCQSSGYHSQSSKTYKPSQTPFSVTYGSGSVSGTLVQDRVTLGTLSVNDQYFGAVTQEDGFQGSPSDGLIGMAFSSIASSGKPTFFENLISAKRIPAPMFSVYLTRGRSAGSEACIGCYDATKATGAVSWVPVTSRTYWAVAMPKALVNGHAVAAFPSRITAAIDTGTTLIYFPQDAANAFYKMIPGAAPATQYGQGFYTYPCNTNLVISLQLGSNVYALNSKDFNLGRTSSNSPDCVGGILGAPDSFPADLAIVGDEFLKSWYLVYDYSHGARVGFAPSINN